MARKQTQVYKVRVVVDTNIVFSALINANNTMGELLLNFQDDCSFFAPEHLAKELLKYKFKLQKSSKLSEKQLMEANQRIMERISLVSEDLISSNSWELAYFLAKDLDEADTPFVALSIELGAKLWTGDKKLATGLKNKGIEMVITSAELTQYLNEKLKK